MPFPSKQIDHINVLLDPNESDASRLGSLKWLTSVNNTVMIPWEIWPSDRVRQLFEAEMRLKRIQERFKELLG
jgi:hypothetical protein